MAIGYIASGGGGGGTLSSDVTAKKENVLIGASTVTSDSDDEIVEGTMPNIGKVTQTLEVNGSYTIPKGYHDGTGKITQSLNTKGATTYYATTSDQTIAANQYLIGAQTIKKITQTNLVAENIKPNVTVKVNNGNSDVFSVTGNMPSKAAATYYPTTSDQVIAASQYLTGAQTIKAVSHQNLIASNIKKGVTVYVKNGSGNIFAVTGIWEGYVAEASDLYYNGINNYSLTRNPTSIAFDSGQITVPNGSNDFCLVTGIQVNMARYSSLQIVGSLECYVTRSDANQHPKIYIDLVDSATDYSYFSSYYYRLFTQDYGSRPDTVTITNITLSWTPQNMTKYLRIAFANEATYGKFRGRLTRLRLS